MHGGATEPESVIDAWNFQPQRCGMQGGDFLVLDQALVFRILWLRQSLSKLHDSCSEAALMPPWCFRDSKLVFCGRISSFARSGAAPRSYAFGSNRVTEEDGSRAAVTMRDVSRPQVPLSLCVSVRSSDRQRMTHGPRQSQVAFQDKARSSIVRGTAAARQEPRPHLAGFLETTGRGPRRRLFTSTFDLPNRLTRHLAERSRVRPPAPVACIEPANR